jgi:cytidylate kinase
VVIAIDGPGGVGKSTVSRAVAVHLGLPYLDTGATYRAATLAVIRSGVDVEDERAIIDELSVHAIGYEGGHILLDGVSVADEVRRADVTAHVSAVSAHPVVRERIVGIQREWVVAHGGDAVVEGRDIGTVVFPEAPVKVFLTARPEVRAERRARDAEAGGASIASVARALARRDEADASRTASPMRPAEDASIIDTSDRRVDEIVDEILALVRSADEQP